MRMSSFFARLFAAMALVMGAMAAQAADPKPGVDFDYLPTIMPTDSPGKVEVIEFFWYGCPHCFHLEPQVEAWAKTLPKDVVFRREHAMFEGNTNWAGHAKLFVALKTLGLVDALTPKVFDAVHNQRVELRDESTLFDWIAKQGVNRAQFEAAYKSFAAQAGFARQIQLSRDYGLDGVPVFIVNGKYRTSPAKVQSEEKTFDVINALIVKERATLKPVKAEAPAADAKPTKKAAKGN
jgi:thiol:disulfide interchange protein DsbA